MTDNAAGQSLPCVEQPLLAVFDSDQDGVLSVEEIRAAAPDNEQLQTIANQLQEQGVIGIRYSNCEETAAATPGAGAHAGNGENGQGLSAAQATGMSVAEMIARAAVKAANQR